MLIGTVCFSRSGLCDFEIPSTVGAIVAASVLGGFVLSHDCEVYYCSYGVSSSVCIPDSVRELCDRCFYWCEAKSIPSLGMRIQNIGIELKKPHRLIERIRIWLMNIHPN